jgi:sugar/nucleoside kinase (ribokinase family)
MLEKGIAVIGSTTIDTNVYADKCFHKIGGVTTYSGITYRHHGITTHIISNVAQKDIRILDHFKHEQLIIHNGFTKQTTQFVNRFETDKRSQEIPFYASPIAADQITNIGDIVSAVHLGPLHSADIDSRCMKILSESGLPVFIDVQGYTRNIRDGHVHPGVSKHLSSVLKICRIAKANETELESILRYFKMDLEQLLTTYGVEEFIVTQGRHGGYVRDYRGCEYPYDAVKIQTVQDPTGAGDVFLAAYTVGRFLKNLDIADACAYAAKTAAKQISGDYITQDKLSLPQRIRLSPLAR